MGESSAVTTGPCCGLSVCLAIDTTDLPCWSVTARRGMAVYLSVEVKAKCGMAVY